MSCGLGAVILILMLVKVGETAPPVEALRLSAELLRVQAETEQLQKALSQNAAAANAADAARAQLTARARKLAATADADAALLEVQRRELAALQKAIKEAPAPAQTEDVISTPDAGEEQYLIGLNVEGRKVGILLDSSASMTDEEMVDILRRKGGSEAERQAGPKWRRAKRAVRWLLARLPKNSEVQVTTFAEKAAPVGGAGWKGARDKKALKEITDALDKLAPAGPTNLQAGLHALNAIQPSNVYIITDGLPTKSGTKPGGLRGLGSCWRSVSTVNGACRLQLFSHTVRNNSPAPGVPVNVVLLPMEGDPQAPDAFWRWTAGTGGLLISPAPGWP